MLSVRSLEEVEPMSIYTSPGISDVLCGLLMLTKKTLKMSCYCIDSEPGIGVLAALLRRGVKISLLLDNNQFKNPSCTRQPSSLLQLLTSAGGEGGQLTVRKYSHSDGPKRGRRQKKQPPDVQTKPSIHMIVMQARRLRCSLLFIRKDRMRHHCFNCPCEQHAA